MIAVRAFVTVETSLEAAARDCIKLAEKLECQILLAYKDVLLTIHQTDTVEEVVNAFWGALPGRN